ncbi:hypothetical protein EPO66_06575 [bacterium]|nr:MAG: hypothetical protein EPO66_06575 [bacterium]
MNMVFIIDYLAYILVRFLGFTLRLFPKSFGLFLGRRIGDLLYYCDLKHKARAYANIKRAFAQEACGLNLNRITRASYRALGQNIIEILFIPLFTPEYIHKYITIEGLDHIKEAFKKGKGVILVGVHEGSWELSNIICANLGFEYNLFVRDQKYPRLSKLLNYYRSYKGCKLIHKENQLRQLIRVLKENQAVGMSLDQGGRSGTIVKFFGKDASMASGAVRTALKYDAAILPVYSVRIKGPYIKFVVEPPFNLKNTGDTESDVRNNLQDLVGIFEKYVRKYPQEYLWTYKIWKYSKERDVLILSDGKTGHLRQSEALAKIISRYLEKKGITANIQTVEVVFKNKLARFLITPSGCLSGKYSCQGCLWCVKGLLKKDVAMNLLKASPDIVISCGSSLAALNYVISRENQAKSLVIMKPSVLSLKRFDLIVVPRHDRTLKRKNVAVIDGALNLIDDEYLKSQKKEFFQSTAGRLFDNEYYLGLLLGGDTKNFKLNPEGAHEIINQIKHSSQIHGFQILITTSRRTSKIVEGLVKSEFSGYQNCKSLIIANENNIASAIGGILGASNIAVVSAESISMISEAVTSGKYTIVFDSKGLSRKHRRFLDYFAEHKYIYLVQPEELGKTIDMIIKDKPAVNALGDNSIVEEALSRIL